MDTISSLLAWGRRTLHAGSIDSAAVEARLLLMHAAGLEEVQIWTDQDAKVDGKTAELYRGLILERVRRRVPLQYLTGQVEFCSLSLVIRPGVFIPRPETELLVEEALALLCGIQRPRIADIGTGCGAIGVALAVAIRDSSVCAVDISKKACECARDNALRLGVDDRVRVVHGDLLHAVPQDMTPLDLIVCNPPYVRTEEIGRLVPEIRLHEPLEALDGGPDGLDVYRRLVALAPAWARSDGLLMVELDPGQMQDALALAMASGQYRLVRFKQDYSGQNRILTLKFK